MRSMIVAVIAVFIALGAGAVQTASADECRISDSALCLANPACHWDADKRGCEPGPLRAPDACSAHGDETICESDVSLGCKWSAEKNICQSKAD